jgi:hypothetical protein
MAMASDANFASGQYFQQVLAETQGEIGIADLCPSIRSLWMGHRRGLNDDFFARANTDMHTIVDFFKVTGISTSSILKVVDGGFGSPLNVASAAVALEKKPVHNCCITMFMIDVLSVALEKVPVRMTAIDEMMEFYFKDALPPKSGWHMTFHLLVTTVDPMPKTFAKLNADEYIAAALGKFSKLIQAGTDIAILKEWANFFRSIPVAIEFLVGSDPIYMRKRQLRENLLNDYEAAGLTAFQEVFEVATYKDIMRSWGSRPPVPPTAKET